MLTAGERKAIQNLKQIALQVDEQSNRTLLLLATSLSGAGTYITAEQREALVSLGKSIQMIRRMSKTF